MTRLKIGDMKGEEKRQNFSKRVYNSDISVIERKCVICSHHKCFDKTLLKHKKGIFCCKCGGTQ